MSVCMKLYIWGGVDARVWPVHFHASSERFGGMVWKSMYERNRNTIIHLLAQAMHGMASHGMEFHAMQCHAMHANRRHGQKTKTKKIFV